MEELLEILTELHPDVDYDSEEHLVDDRIRLDVTIPAEEIIPENFNSAKALGELISRLEDE